VGQVVVVLVAQHLPLHLRVAQPAHLELVVEVVVVIMVEHKVLADLAQLLLLCQLQVIRGQLQEQ
jgi:hypothetical protein